MKFALQSVKIAPNFFGKKMLCGLILVADIFLGYSIQLLLKPVVNKSILILLQLRKKKPELSKSKRKGAIIETKQNLMKAMPKLFQHEAYVTSCIKP